MALKLVIETKLDKKGFESGLNSLKSVASTGFKTMATAVGVVSTAIAGITKAAVNIGAEFEAQMSKVSAISGATGDDLERLTDKAKEMGATTKFTATESAQALEYMAMAGWKTEDMLGGIEGVMSLAAASGEDLATTSDIVTDALTAMGLKAKDAGHFADVLAVASSNSNTNVALMGETFKYAASVAGSLNYSIEDTAVAIGLMANAGIKGTQAGTSLRSIMTRLATDTNGARTQLEELGIQVVNSDGSMRDFGDVMGDLREKFKGLSEEEKVNIANTVAGKNALSGFLAIANSADEDFQKLTEAMANADGTAKSMADTMQNNLSGQFTILKSGIQGLGLELYEGMQKPLMNVVKSAQGYIKQLTDAFKKDGVKGMAAAAGDMIASIVTKFAQSAPKLVNLAVTVIQSFVSGIQQNLPAIMEAVTQVITTLVVAFIDMLPQILDIGIKIIFELINGITAALPQLIPAIVGVITNIVAVIIQNLPKIIESGIKILTGLIQGIVEAIPQLIEMLPTIIDAIITGIVENLPLIVEAGIKLIIALIEGLIKAIPQLVTYIPQIIIKIVQTLVKNFPKIVQAGKDILTNLKNGAISMVGMLISNIATIPGKIISTLKNGLSSIGNVGKNLVQGIWNGINNAKQWVLDKIAGFGKAIVSGIKSIFGIKSPSTVMRDEVGKYLAQGVGVGFEDELDNVYDDMQKAIDLETGKMSADVQSSGTYQMAMAGLPTFNLLDNSQNQTQLVVNGKVLAEVVNTENRNREVASQ